MRDRELRGKKHNFPFFPFSLTFSKFMIARMVSAFITIFYGRRESGVGREEGLRGGVGREMGGEWGVVTRGREFGMKTGL